MSRQEKRSRIRMLPARLQLQQRDAHTGSYPTVSRFSTDGRSGIYNVSFNDTKTVIFTSSVNYKPAIGFPTGNTWLTNSASNDLTASITTTGNLRSQVIEGLPFVHFTTGQELTPFRDNNQPAADGKSSNSSFFTTGSSDLLVGGGFSSPLWSKNKIEIDIGVDATCGAELYLSGAYYSPNPSDFNGISGLSASHEMLYYNFELRQWQGIGFGVPYGNFGLGYNADGLNNADSMFYDNAMFGFAPSVVNLFATDIDVSTQVSGVFEWQASAGEPFSNFGFPYHQKYHATSSQTCNMSQYINGPFLVEKIVVELSAAYIVSESNVYSVANYTNSGFGVIADITDTTMPACVNNFFILNQRRSSRYAFSERTEAMPHQSYSDDNIITGSVPVSFILSRGASAEETYVDTARDIITWGGVSSFANNMQTTATRSGTPAYSSVAIPTLTKNPKELMTRDCVFTSSADCINDLENLSWGGRVYMELPVKSLIKIDRTDLKSDEAADKVFSFFKITAPVAAFANVSCKQSADILKSTHGRNIITPVASIQQQGGFQNVYTTNTENILISSVERYKHNPYILFPEDRLVFGWQQPTFNMLVWDIPPGNTGQNTVDGKFSDIRFLPGVAKVTLYGSYIREGKEYNDGTNQLLSSNSVHEGIGGD